MYLWGFVSVRPLANFPVFIAKNLKRVFGKNHKKERKAKLKEQRESTKGKARKKT